MDQFERAAKSRIQEAILYSKPLFTLAYKRAQVLGRGILLQVWPSLAACANSSSVRPDIHYLPFFDVQKLDYLPAVDLARQYNLLSDFVIVIGIQTGDSRDSILHAAMLSASISDTLLPTLETHEALAALGADPNDSGADSADGAAEDAAFLDPLFFTTLLSPFTPKVHAALCAAGGRAALPLVAGQSSSPNSLSSGLNISTLDGQRATLSLISTCCSRPECHEIYDLPSVSADAGLADTDSSDPSESAEVGRAAEETESEPEAVVDDDAGDGIPYFPASLDASDARSWCSGCFLQTYCNLECQTLHWNAGHANHCQRLRLAYISQKCTFVCVCVCFCVCLCVCLCVCVCVRAGASNSLASSCLTSYFACLHFPTNPTVRLDEMDSAAIASCKKSKKKKKKSKASKTLPL